MVKLNRFGLSLLIIGGLIVGCEEDSTPEVLLPLAGNYSLNEMTINVEAHTLRDTLLTFAIAQDGVESIQIDAGTFVLSTSTLYTDHDSIPISGTIILRNNGTATLDGILPVNFGTGCAPNKIGRAHV